MTPAVAMAGLDLAGSGVSQHFNHSRDAIVGDTAHVFIFGRRGDRLIRRTSYKTDR